MSFLENVWSSHFVNCFQVCLLTNEGPWYHSGTQITMYKRLFLFLPPNISIFICYPSLFGNGEMAHEGFSESSSPSWADCKSSVASQTYSITQHAFTPLTFVSHMVCEGKIYLAHTLEWHTWFWQYTFWNPKNIENS